VAVHALLGTGRALRNVANRRFHILGCQRLLLCSLSFEAFVVFPMPARGVSLPAVQAARLFSRNCTTWVRHSRVTFPHIGPRQQTRSEDGDNYVCRWPPKQPPLDSLRG